VGKKDNTPAINITWTKTIKEKKKPVQEAKPITEENKPIEERNTVPVVEVKSIEEVKPTEENKIIEETNTTPAVEVKSVKEKTSSGKKTSERKKLAEEMKLYVSDVLELHQGIEPKIEKIVEVKTDLKKQIELLKKEAHMLIEAAKKMKPVRGEVIEKKEEATKSDQLLAKAAEIEVLAQELEDLEAEFNFWKEDVAITLKGQKDKISKEVYDKLEASKEKFAQLNDRLGKSIEKVIKSAQQPQN